MGTRRIVTIYDSVPAVGCDAPQAVVHGADPHRARAIREQRHDRIVARASKTFAIVTPFAHRPARLIDGVQASAKGADPHRAGAILREGCDVVDHRRRATLPAMTK